MSGRLLRYRNTLRMAARNRDNTILQSRRNARMLAVVAAVATSVNDPLTAAGATISQGEAHELALAAVSDSGYPADRVWDYPATWDLLQCSRGFYCFGVRVDAGAWSPIIASLAIAKADGTVWELWECRELATPELTEKQAQLRQRHHLKVSVVKPTEFLSDCLDSTD